MKQKIDKKAHLFSGNPDGRNNLIIAYTKKQLCNYFGCSYGYLNQYICDLGTKEEGNLNWNSEDIIDLTNKVDNPTPEIEKRDASEKDEAQAIRDLSGATKVNQGETKFKDSVSLNILDTQLNSSQESLGVQFLKKIDLLKEGIVLESSGVHTNILEGEKVFEYAREFDRNGNKSQ